MHLYEEAVEMALGVNLDLAIEQVNRAKDDIEFIDVSHAPATFRPQWRVEDGEKKGGGVMRVMPNMYTRVARSN